MFPQNGRRQDCAKPSEGALQCCWKGLAVGLKKKRKGGPDRDFNVRQNCIRSGWVSSYFGDSYVEMVEEERTRTTLGAYFDSPSSSLNALLKPCEELQAAAGDLQVLAELAEEDASLERELAG